MGLFSKLFKGSYDPYNKYTPTWFRGVSNEELDEEREKVRQDLYIEDCAERAMRYLDQFDREKARRYSEEHKDDPPVKARHREHGWYLDNDE